MNYEEKIKELTERIEVLEKAENKRIAKRKIRLIWNIVKTVIILGAILFGYIYINIHYIKPYKEKIDYVNDKVENIQSFIDDKWQSIQKLVPFIKQ